MEQLLMDALAQTPGLVIVLALCWYHRRDLLDQISKLQEQIDTNRAIMYGIDPDNK